MVDIAIWTVSTTIQVNLIKKREFAAIILDPRDEIFVVYVAFLTIFDEIHPSNRETESLITDR